MPTFADEIAEALDELREQYDGFDMTYRRGAIEIELERVVKGQSIFKYSDPHGFAVHTETHDIIVEVAQMGGVEPRAGDQVTEMIYQDETPIAMETFDVVSVNKERVWYYSDVGRTTIRIHTMLRKREPIP